MSSDEFSSRTGATIEQLMLAAAGAVVGEATKDPLAGAFATAAAFSAVDFFKAKTSQNDESWRKAELAALYENFQSLDERIKKLEADLGAQRLRLDRQDVLSKGVIFSDFAREVAGASTSEKREALVNATARQFDPRQDQPSVRSYWLGRLRDLPEMQLSVLLQAAKHRGIFFQGGEMLTFEQQLATPVAMSAQSVTTFATVAESMILDRSPLLGKNGPVQYATSRDTSPQFGYLFSASPAGMILANWCRDL
jgi:hypothetical protein